MDMAVTVAPKERKKIDLHQFWDFFGNIFPTVSLL
jgi:hypothetical protein